MKNFAPKIRYVERDGVLDHKPADPKDPFFETLGKLVILDEGPAIPTYTPRPEDPNYGLESLKAEE